MTRFPSPQKSHKPKDLCTIEQAEAIARVVADFHVRRYAHHLKVNRWYRKLWRAVVKPFTRKPAA